VVKVPVFWVREQIWALVKLWNIHTGRERRGEVAQHRQCGGNRGEARRW
jgi:hypothetical protein